MKIKNILCLVLCVALVLNLACFTAFADENVTIAVADKVIDADMTSFDVQIRVTSNPGIAALGFDVRYDDYAMELVDVTNGTVFDNDDITEGVLWQNPYTVSCMTPHGNSYKTGTLVTLHFELYPNADAGNYDIILYNAEAFKLNETEVNVITRSGNVTVNEITHNSLAVAGTKIIVEEDTMRAWARLNITANPGIAVLGLGVGYNDNHFRLVNIYEEELSDTLPLTYGNFNKNPYQVLAYNEYGNTDARGYFLTFEFDVLTIPEGNEYVTLSDAEAFNYDENEVPVKLINYSKSAETELGTNIEMTDVVVTDDHVSFTIEPKEEIALAENAVVIAAMYGQNNSVRSMQLKTPANEVDFSMEGSGTYVKVLVIDTHNLKPLSKPLYYLID